MKNKKSLIILLIILIGLCIATAVAVGIQSVPEETEQISEQVILPIDKESVTQINVTNNQGQFSFEKDGDTWIYSNKPNMTINQDVPDTIADAICNMTILNTVNNPEDTSVYGTDTPAITVNVTADKEYSIDIGDMTTTSTDRYVSVGDGNIYVTNALLFNKLNFSESDFLVNDSIPEIITISSATMSVDDKTAEIKNEMVLNSLLNAIRNISLSDCVNTDANEQDLESFGLTSPCLNVQIVFSNKSSDDNNFAFSISISPDENNQYYIKLADSSKVYVLDNETATSLLTIYYEAIR